MLNLSAARNSGSCHCPKGCKGPGVGCMVAEGTGTTEMCCPAGATVMVGHFQGGAGNRYPDMTSQ